MSASDSNSISGIVATAYAKSIQINLSPMGILNARNNSPRISPVESKEFLQDLSYSIENVISDLLPDADKDLPRLIAVAVITQLNDDDALIIRVPVVPPEDAQPLSQSISILAQNIQSMSMGEYAKIRPQLFAGIINVPSTEEPEDE